MRRAVLAVVLALVAGAAVAVASEPPLPLSSSLVSEVDASDTFTAGVNGRAADQAYPAGGGNPSRLIVESTPGTPVQSWTDGKWSFADDTHHTGSGWCGPSGRGSETGVVQAGVPELTVPGVGKDWGIEYGARTDFVLQTDVCVPAGSTVLLTTSSVRDTRLQGDGMSVRLRTAGDSRGEVVLNLPGAGGDHPTQLTSGLTAGRWHVLAARFDLSNQVVYVYTDGALRGQIDFGEFAAAYHPSNAAVSVGIDLPPLDPAQSQAAWFDNFLVGAPAGAPPPPTDPGYVQGPTVTPPADPRVAFRLFKGTMSSELGPGAPPTGGDGNTYAADVHLEHGIYRMWYGGQGIDGHEHIHYAESTDGFNWKRYGIVLSEAPGRKPPGEQTFSLIEDASVVKVDGVYHMYYTAAAAGVNNVIRHATSSDGLAWDITGTVLTTSPFPAWDSLDVARPSVRYEGPGVWKMWYDGCQGPNAGIGVEQCMGFRNTGYATSTDGIHWTKHPANPVIPVFEAVDVISYRGMYFMVGENQQGTRLQSSPDGVAWTDQGYLVGLSGGPDDAHGHITPYIKLGRDGRPSVLYIGLARAGCWCQNLMGAALLDGTELDAFVPPGAPAPQPFYDFDTPPSTSTAKCKAKGCKEKT